MASGSTALYDRNGSGWYHNRSTLRPRAHRPRHQQAAPDPEEHAALPRCCHAIHPDHASHHICYVRMVCDRTRLDWGHNKTFGITFSQLSAWNMAQCVPDRPQ